MSLSLKIGLLDTAWNWLLSGYLGEELAGPPQRLRGLPHPPVMGQTAEDGGAFLLFLKSICVLFYFLYWTIIALTLLVSGVQQSE